tara:strand:+ start:13648 stop:13764 length:117 start_codon:yes stop_codon:yes gene_type:complete
METIIIKLHYSSSEERAELLEYLNNECWDYEEKGDSDV